MESLADVGGFGQQGTQRAVAGLGAIRRVLPAVDLNKALAPEAERDSLELASQEREGYTDLLSD